MGGTISTANHLQNHLPTKSNEKPLHERWTKRKPNIYYLRVFGCKAYVYINKTKRGKLEDRAVQGYLFLTTGCKIYTEDGSGRVILPEQSNS